MKIRVFDVETDGLLGSLTKIHNLCYTEDGENYHYTTSYDTMKEWLDEPDVIWVGHNIVMFDFEAIKRVLGVHLSYNNGYDTLAISWALYADRAKHGLASWGDDVGIQKVFVEDGQWESGDPELMKSRVEEDVKINWKVWKLMDQRLTEIYGDDTSNKEAYLRFLSFRMDVLREQEANPLTLDVEACEKHVEHYESLKAIKVEELTASMPKRPILKSKNKPKVMTTKDGSISALGQKWHEFLQEQGIDKNTVGPVNFIDGYEEPNPNSNDQIKNWLYSLGWKPKTFKYQRNKLTGDEKKIEQVRKDGMLCESVLDLAYKDPAIEMLDGLTVLSHRIGVLKGFLKHQVDGKLVSGAGGFTNTLRLQHRSPIVNLPGVDSKYGKPCRDVLVAPEGTVMIGADVTSLEDSLKQHFIYPHDSKYVQEMNTEGFDPHLSLAIDAGRLTQEDYDYYTTCTNESEVRFKAIKAIRKPMKTVNYACQYSVGSKTLSRNSGMTIKEAQELIDVYWKKNWAVNKVADEQYVKTLKDGSMWLKNPINGFYYSLRYERDKFSTLVQGSGDYLFNLWLLYCRNLGIKVSMTMHDEWLTIVPEGQQNEVIEKAKEAMNKVNEKLKLNKTISMDVQVGYSYADCH